LRAAFFVLVAAALTLGACDDALTGPRQWVAITDTVTLYSVARAEYIGRRSAFDFIAGDAVAIEAPGVAGGYDVALSEQAGALVLLPSGVIEARDTRAALALAPAGQTFEASTEAPQDTALYRHASGSTVAVGQLYFVRSRVSSCSGLVTGSRYGKLQVLAADPARGTATFQFLRNPYCEDRALVPPEE
jgi:hypothetical protein